MATNKELEKRLNEQQSALDQILAAVSGSAAPSTESVTDAVAAGQPVAATPAPAAQVTTLPSAITDRDAKLGLTVQGKLITMFHVDADGAPRMSKKYPDKLAGPRRFDAAQIAWIRGLSDDDLAPLVEAISAPAA